MRLQRVVTICLNCAFRNFLANILYVYNYTWYMYVVSNIFLGSRTAHSVIRYCHDNGYPHPNNIVIIIVVMNIMCIYVL